MNGDSVVDALTAPAPRDSLDEALGSLFALGAVALHARCCSLYLCAGDGAALVLQHETGLAARDEARRIPIDGTVSGMIVRTRVPLLVQNVDDYPALPLHPERYRASSFLSVPILVENNAVGVLNATERRDGQPFTEADLQGGEMVARSIAAVLHSDDLTRRAVGQSEIDPTTGLYNLPHLWRRLEQETQRALREQTPLTLLLLRVQGYDDLVSRLGVQVGGVLMRCVGELVAHTVRQSDVLARSAGDEIAVLLPSTPPDKARRVARVIVREVTHERLPAHLRYDLEHMNLHIGLAALSTDMSSADLMNRTRAAVEEARTRGDTLVEVVGDQLSDVQMADTTRQTRQQPAHRRAIATALSLGIPYLADPASAALPAAAALLDVETARSYLCVPIAFEGHTLTLAMADPTDGEAIQAISERTGMAIYPVTSPREKILQAITALMAAHPQPPVAAIRLVIPATPGAAAFMRQVQRVASCLEALDIPDVRVGGEIAIEPADEAAKRVLLAGMTAMPDLPLRPDGRDPMLLHTSPADTPEE